MTRSHERSRRHSREMVTYANFGSRGICLEAKCPKYIQKEDTSLKTKATPATAPSIGIGECRKELSIEVMWVYRIIV